MTLGSRQTLNQILAPQMRQGLEILQTPTLELEAIVSQELAQNPVLEDARANPDTDTSTSDNSAADPWDASASPQSDKSEVEFYQRLSERLDQLSEDFGSGSEPTHSTRTFTSEDDERRQFLFDSAVAEPNLQDHLLEQLRLTGHSDLIKTIAEEIIGNLGHRGYLDSQPGEDPIARIALNHGWEYEDVEDALGHVQSMDPAGVGARDLRECLLLQIRRAGREDTLEGQIIDKRFDLLSRRRFPEIARATGRSPKEVQEAAERIATLEFNPGRDFSSVTREMVSPDVFIEKDETGEYTVSSNNDHIPQLRISRAYKDLIQQATTSPELRSYLRDKVRSGNFLITSLAQREQTIVRIAKEIVARQKEFLDKGPSYLKPMTMGEIAHVVEVHETTVSRAVAGKYAATPQGVIELRSFFSSGLKSDNGEDITNQKVKDLITKFIQCEDTKKPLSDDRLAAMLKQEGIQVARRTIAKYRGELGILPSSQRKVY